MKQLFLVLGLVFCVACADTGDDTEFEQDSMPYEADAGLGMKSQALGTPCPGQLTAPLTTPDSRFNSSGWTGQWFLTNEQVAFGTRVCGYNANPGATFWAGYTVGRNCSPVFNTAGKGWLCGLNRIDCPSTANVGTPWTNIGPATVGNNPTSQYTPNSGNFDAVNKRIWCGYNQYSANGPYSFYRAESY